MNYFQKNKKYLAIFGFPLLYALILRYLFSFETFENIWGLLSIAFLFIGPFIIGILTTYFSDIEDLNSWTYKTFVPWISIALFLFATVLLNVEGWACWVIVTPLFLIASSIGGFIGAALKKKKANKTYISIAMLLPFLIAPIEKWVGSNPKTFKAYNYVDIEAPADKIWGLITRVQTIQEHEDTGWLNKFLGFPRPVEAELNYEGVGAYRKAIFTNGLVFHETVTSYEHLKKLTFDIKANPHEIPSTTLDEHVVVGGKFFNVLNGTYELEQLGNNKYRLHLYSHFVMNTTFNSYAGMWARWIMQDIQQNILRIEKIRAES